jgi:hypothetical protein
MKVNHVRTLAARSALFAAPLATLVLGFCLQACGGVGPDGEPIPGDPTSTTPATEVKPGESKADLTILGINVPQPTITFGLGDASTKIDPIGTIDTLVPEPGVNLPDPFAPVDGLITGLGKPITAGVGVGDLGVSIKLPPLLPPDLGGFLTGLDPFADGGIQLIAP